MKNACIVGLGAIGPVHAHAVQKTEYANICAVCDTDKARADKYGKLYKAKIYYSFEDVLADDDINSVHICTPHYLHKDMAVKALNAGKHIVLEKPAVMKPDELEELEKAYSASGKKSCIMLQNRTNTCIQELKHIIDTDKTLGKLMGICAFLTWNRTADYYASAEWRGSWAHEGGGVLINQAVHLIDLVDYLGNISEIKSDLTNKATPSIEVEDTAEALFKLKNGSKAIFFAANTFSVDAPFRLEMFFENAAFRYADNKLYKICDDVEIISSDVQIIDGKKCWGGGHRKVIDDFYKNLETGSGEYIDLSNGFHSAKVMLSMYKKGLNLGKDWHSVNL